MVRWLAQLAWVLYAAALVARLAPRAEHVPWRVARILWSLAWLSLVLHVASAFHLVHHWSHQAAYEHTARQTAELTGIDWGGGVIINYVFIAVWLFDLCWWWTAERSYRNRSGWIEAIVQFFFAFMFFNSVVVFGPSVTRMPGIVACALMLGLAVRRIRMGP